MHYNARWYDRYLNRFTQADTIIPLESQGVQAWDRYAGMNNNPVRYSDPSGHRVCDEERGCEGELRYTKRTNPIDIKIAKQKDKYRNGFQTPQYSNYPGNPGNAGYYPANSIIVGEPCSPGDYAGGYCSGWGTPTSVVAAGFYAEQEGERSYVAGKNASLSDYQAAFSMTTYENMVHVEVVEKYKFGVTDYSEDYLAYSVMNVQTANNEVIRTKLGDFLVSPTKTATATTHFFFYGDQNRPQRMWIEFVITIKNMAVLSAPFPTYSLMP